MPAIACNRDWLDMSALFIPLLVVLALMTSSAQAFQLKAERVVDNVYALIGPLGQRSADNDGLNANFGFVVTPEGVILIDTGASRLGAERIAATISEVSDKPVRWVINTGSQDHRWLGNAFFAEKGAKVIALPRTAATQAEFATHHMASMKRFLGARMQGTRPLPAPNTLAGNSATLELGSETLVLAYTDAQYPSDAWIWLQMRR